MEASDLQAVQRAADEYGYAVVVGQGVAYTYGHDPVYVVAGLNDVLMTQVLQRTVQGVQIFGEYDVKFVNAERGLLDGIPADARVVQVLWPDVYGVFPDEDGYRGTEQLMFT